MGVGLTRSCSAKPSGKEGRIAPLPKEIHRDLLDVGSVFRQLTAFIVARSLLQSNWS